MRPDLKKREAPSFLRASQEPQGLTHVGEHGTRRGLGKQVPEGKLLMNRTAGTKRTAETLGALLVISVIAVSGAVVLNRMLAVLWP